MKKILFILIAAVATSTAANAQSIFGIKKERPVVVTDPGQVITIPGPVIVDDRNDRDYDNDRRVRNRRNLPPGQAKKIYGHQSAKAFAPGQQKKRSNSNWNDRDDWNDYGNGNNRKIKNNGKGKGKGKNKH